MILLTSPTPQDSFRNREITTDVTDGSVTCSVTPTHLVTTLQSIPFPAKAIVASLRHRTTDYF